MPSFLERIKSAFTRKSKPTTQSHTVNTPPRSSTRKVESKPPRHPGLPRGSIPRQTQTYPEVHRRESPLKVVLPVFSRHRRQSNASIRHAASIGRARIHMSPMRGLPSVVGERNNTTIRLKRQVEPAVKRPHNKA